VHNHSYENEFNLHVNDILFSYERTGAAETRFEEEAGFVLVLRHASESIT